FQEGDTVLLKGYQMVIDAGNVGSGLETQLITSNTSGKFTEAWPGASGTFSYRMRYQSNDSRLSAKVSDFLLRTASGNITAIGELTTSTDTMAYFTGAGTAGLTGLTAYARSILDDANASAVLTTLGFSAFAKTIIDDTSGAAMWATMGGV